MKKQNSRLDRHVVRFTKGVIRFRWAVVAAALFLTAVAGKNSTGLFFDTDYRAFFSDENPQVQAFDELQEVYTKNDNILFVVAPQDNRVFGASSLVAVEELVDEAWKIPYAIRVDAVTNFQHTFAEYDDLVVENLIEDAAHSTDGVLAAAQRVALAEPLIRDRLINGEASVTGVNVTLQLPGEDPSEVTTAVEAARRISDRFRADNPGIDLYMTGFAMLNNAFQEISVSELTRLMPVMFGLMILLMVVMLRSATGTFATILIIALSTIVAMGLAGIFKVGLTPPSAQAPTIIMTLAIADSIHILVTMLREMRNGVGKFDAIVESIRVNASPVFLTSFSTVIGFLSLNFSDVPPFNHLGNITAAGVTAAFFLSVIFLPALLAILPIRTRAQSASSRPSPIMDRLAEFVIDRRRMVLAGSTVIVFLFAALIPTNELDDRFVEYFDHRIEFRTDTDFTSENLTGIYQIEFSLNSGESGGVSNPEYLATVDAFADWYRSQPDVVHVSSISDVMKRLNKNLNGDDESFYRLPDNREMAAQYLLLYEMSLPYGLDLNNQINVDKSATRFTVTTNNTSASRFRQLTEEGQDWLTSNAARPMSSSGSGPAVMFSYISGININSMLKGSLIALVLISFLMIFALRSVKLGMISFIPNLLPAVVAFGVWAVLNGTVNLGLSIVIGMTMGIVVDDSIHFLTKYRRARVERGSNAEDAVRYAFSSVGRAIMVTSVILVAGFGILSTSAFGMNADMGLMTAITIGLALVIDLLALPAILIWLDAAGSTAAATATYSDGGHYVEPSPVRVTN